MSESRTIFLATDGWYLVIDRTRRNDGLIPGTLEALKAQGLRGWLATMRDSSNDQRLPQVVPVHSVGQVTEAEWPAAVEALQHGFIIQV